MINQYWAVLPTSYTNMDKLNIPFFYQSGHQLNALTILRVYEVSVSSIITACAGLRPTLQSLLAFPSLKVAQPVGEELQNLIDGLFSGFGAQKFGQVDFTSPIDSKNAQLQTDVSAIIRKALDFQTVLNAELQSLAAYVVTTTGIYSVPDLVDNAENVIPVGLKDKLSDFALKEIRQSGRCLAFGMGTASAFHIVRATEAVMHQYYEKVSKKKMNSLDNWGAYIAELRKSNNHDATRIAEILQQVKDHDRNLIMHPEMSLDEGEAHTLFEVAKGAIMAMAEKL